MSDPFRTNGDLMDAIATAAREAAQLLTELADGPPRMHAKPSRPASTIPEIKVVGAARRSCPNCTPTNRTPVNL